MAQGLSDFLSSNSSEDQAQDILKTAQDQVAAAEGAAQLNRFFMKKPW